MNFIAMKIAKASRKLLIGPAAETEMLARSLLRHLSGFVSTGFAHPIIGGSPCVTDKNPISGIKIVPMGSMWAIGLSDILPCKRPVSSPNQYEVRA